jgi:protein-tyrosine kinase
MNAFFRKIDLARLTKVPAPDRDPGAVGPDTAQEDGIAVAQPINFRHQRITLEPLQRERERILDPGAPGPAGGPYKMLRAQVLRRMSQLSATTLAVLSAGKGEGKTLTALNLAIAVAADASHTALLVDLDLRNPSIAERLGFKPTIGIEECLRDRRPVYEAMVKVAGYERLTVLPARARVEQSSELLSTQRAADLMYELRTRYANRVVIFDLPPVLLADDALAFSRHVQTGLLVIAEGRSAREGVMRSLRLLDNLPIVGTVLNASRERVGAYY